VDSEIKEPVLQLGHSFVRRPGFVLFFADVTTIYQLHILTQCSLALTVIMGNKIWKDTVERGICKGSTGKSGTSADILTFLKANSL
jgi:hypothetical protein